MKKKEKKVERNRWGEQLVVVVAQGEGDVMESVHRVIRVETRERERERERNGRVGLEVNKDRTNKASANKSWRQFVEWSWGGKKSWPRATAAGIAHVGLRERRTV